MNPVNLLVTTMAAMLMGLAFVLEIYKTLGRRRRMIEGFEVIGLNVMGWGLISLAGVLLGVVVMRGGLIQ